MAVFERFLSPGSNSERRFRINNSLSFTFAGALEGVPLRLCLGMCGNFQTNSVLTILARLR